MTRPQVRVSAHAAALLAPLALLIGSLGAAGCAPGHRMLRPTPQQRLSLPYPTPAAQHYATEPSVQQADDAGRLVDAIVATAARRGHALQADGRLSTLAAWAFAERQGTQLPPQTAIDAAAHHLGIVEPTPAMVVYRLSDPGALQQHVADDIAATLDQRTPTHVGAFVEQSAGSATAVVVLAGRHLQLQPLARVLPAQPAVELHGTLLTGHSAPELIVMHPEGHMDRSSLGPGPTFAARASLGAPGRYDIELLAQGPRGLTVVANFPLHVGVPEPATIELALPAADIPGADVAQTLLDLINQARARQQLPPVARRADLDRIAQAHCDDMDQHGFVGHSSPTTGTVADRVAAAGIETPLTAENIGRNYSAAGVHAGLMASPGHRANVLHPQATHVGIGVVREPEGEHVALLATEVFIHVPRRLDPQRAAREGLQALDAAREARGLPSLHQESVLNTLASKAAASYFAPGSPSQDAAAKVVHVGLADLRLPYAHYQTLALVGSAIDLSRIDTLLDPQARAVGVGFAQGARPDAKLNPVTIAIVVLGY